MPQTVIQKTLNLDLDGIPQDRRKEAKEEVGEFLVNESIRYMEEGKSPVAGERPWRKLNKEYAQEEHAGDRTPTLNLTGRMRDSFQFRTTNDGVKIGIFHKSQQSKAEGHCHFQGKSELPRRRFVPSSEQNYKAEIMANVERILEGYRTTKIDLSGDIDRQAASLVLTRVIDRIFRGTTEDTGTLNVAALAGGESLQEILQRRFGRFRDN